MKALQIAHWFMNRANIDEQLNGGDQLSLLKLEKLLYYADGCSLATTGEQLFSEDMYAWKHGPVVKEVYDEYSSNPYSLPITESSKADAAALPESTKELLESVYDIWGEYSAWGLRNQTHKETPWLAATNGGTNFGEKIDRGIVKDYFQRNYVQ